MNRSPSPARSAQNVADGSTKYGRPLMDFNNIPEHSN